MSKFKVGDKVRVIADAVDLEGLDLTGHVKTGLETRISEINHVAPWPYRITETWWFRGQDLELTERPVDNTITIERFDKLVDYIVEKQIKAVMCAKSAEYARGSDKLHNFKRAAEIDRISPEEALRGMHLKHRCSISDMLDDLMVGKHHPRELWEEKFGDTINYYILLYALLVERYGWDVC